MVPQNILTAYEQKVVADADFMYARNIIIKKVIDLFGYMAEGYKEIAAENLPADWLLVPPKITRGEQYLQLPYVVLDYPRNFTKDNKLAIRTFFWWGNHFSIHLHLSGNYMGNVEESLLKALNAGFLNDWFICVNATEWEHHFEENNYLPLDRTNAQQFLLHRPFLKLAKKIPLIEWNKIDEILLQDFSKIVDAITP